MSSFFFLYLAQAPRAPASFRVAGGIGACLRRLSLLFVFFFTYCKHTINHNAFRSLHTLWSCGATLTHYAVLSSCGATVPDGNVVGAALTNDALQAPRARSLLELLDDNDQSMTTALVESNDAASAELETRKFEVTTTRTMTMNLKFLFMSFVCTMSPHETVFIK